MYGNSTINHNFKIIIKNVKGGHTPKHLAFLMYLDFNDKSWQPHQGHCLHYCRDHHYHHQQHPRTWWAMRFFVGLRDHCMCACAQGWEHTTWIAFGYSLPSSFCFLRKGTLWVPTSWNVFCLETRETGSLFPVTPQDGSCLTPLLHPLLANKGKNQCRRQELKRIGVYASLISCSVLKRQQCPLSCIVFSSFNSLDQVYQDFPNFELWVATNPRLFRDISFFQLGFFFFHFTQILGGSE
jgi:hypothetical protein